MHQDLLTRHIKIIDDESKFNAKYLNTSERLGISTDDLMDSIKLLIENNLPKDSYAVSDQYINNYCEERDVKRDKVSIDLINMLEKDRRDQIKL